MIIPGQLIRNLLSSHFGILASSRLSICEENVANKIIRKEKHVGGVEEEIKNRPNEGLQTKNRI